MGGTPAFPARTRPSHPTVVLSRAPVCPLGPALGDRSIPPIVFPPPLLRPRHNGLCHVCAGAAPGLELCPHTAAPIIDARCIAPFTLLRAPHDARSRAPPRPGRGGPARCGRPGLPTPLSGPALAGQGPHSFSQQGYRIHQIATSATSARPCWGGQPCLAPRPDERAGAGQGRHGAGCPMPATHGRATSPTLTWGLYGAPIALLRPAWDHPRPPLLSSPRRAIANGDGLESPCCVAPLEAPRRCTVYEEGRLGPDGGPRGAALAQLPHGPVGCSLQSTICWMIVLGVSRAPCASRDNRQEQVAIVQKRS